MSHIDFDALFASPWQSKPSRPSFSLQPPPGWPEGMALPPWWPQLVEVFPVEAAWQDPCQGCGFPVLVLARVDSPKAPFAGRAWFCPQCGHDPGYELAGAAVQACPKQNPLQEQNQ